MCGIAGAVDQERERARRRVLELNRHQQHRGPDDATVVGLGAFTLGNTRLAIQDPTPAGNQPFRSSDGRYTCVFNGEIYNYKELIDQFRLSLPNQCDGAVIPELWSRFGPGCLRKFRGMFAIAIVDIEASTVTLCRDPFGIKPLYMRRVADGALLFASEVRPLACVDVFPIVSRQAVAQYLHLGALPADASPFEGIEAVPPNTVLTLNDEGRGVRAPIVSGPHPLLCADSSGQERRSRNVGSVLRQSVELHVRSDVPVVLLLSSGVDSTALASAARQQGHDLHCITVAEGGATDESAAAAVNAKQYGHEHEIVRADIDEGMLAEYFLAMQRPTIDGLNTFIVCRAVRASGYRVALSGLGGDEALGGYSHYRLLPLLRLLPIVDRIPWLATTLCAVGGRVSQRLANEKVRRLLASSGPRNAWELDQLQRELHSPNTVRELTGVDVAHLDQVVDPSLSFEALVEAELANYMQSTLLPDADAFSMCSSVELRVPFVDREFFAAAAEANRGRLRPVGKTLVAEALQDDYLRDLCRRPKRGFSLPMASWLAEGPLRNVVAGLSEDAAPIWDVVNRPAALRTMATASARRWSELWSLAALNQWLTSFEDQAVLTRG